VSVADITKASIRLAPGDAVIQSLYAELGIAGVSIPAAQVDGALVSHAIDTCYATPAAMIALQWSTKGSYESSLSLGYRTVAIVLTPSAMSGISSRDQKVILEAIDHAAKRQRESTLGADATAASTLRKHGLSRSDASAELGAAFDAAARKTWQ